MGMRGMTRLDSANKEYTKGSLGVTNIPEKIR